MSDRVQQVTDKVTEKVSDPAWRKDMAAQASQAAAQASQAVRDAAVSVGHEAGSLAGKAGEGIVEVKDEMAGLLPKRNTRGRTARKWMRRVVALGAAGAAARYFLDPREGRLRRAQFRDRTSTTANTVGDGLEKVAQAAHTAADMTARPEGDMPAQRMEPTDPTEPVTTTDPVGSTTGVHRN